MAHALSAVITHVRAANRLTSHAGVLLAEIERLTVENEHLTVDAEMDGSVKRLLRAEVERLREALKHATVDAWVLACCVNGWTPDLNTQTTEEVAATESEIIATAERSVARGMAAESAKEPTDV